MNKGRKNDAIRKYLGSASVVVLFVSSLIVFPSTTRTFRYLHIVWFDAMTDLGQLTEQFMTPGAGEHVLPLAAREMIGLLRKNRVESFRYSSAVEQNEEMRQRLLEGAYPIRYAADSRFVVLYAAEPLPPGCFKSDAWGGVTLAHCP